VRRTSTEGTPDYIVVVLVITHFEVAAAKIGYHPLKPRTIKRRAVVHISHQMGNLLNDYFA
jgi:hypothetical protein